MLARLLAVTSLALLGSCATTSPTAAPADSWALASRDLRIAGGTSAALTSRDSDFLEETAFDAAISIGKMVSPDLLAQVVFTGAVSDQDLPANATLDTVSYSLEGGARYYFDGSGQFRPFLDGRAGIAYIDIDTGAASADDTSPLFSLRGGIEQALNDRVSLTYGLRLTQLLDREINGLEDDITEYGAFFEIAVWN